MSGTVRLAQEFPAFSEADWQRAVQRARRVSEGAESASNYALPLFPRARNARPVIAHVGGAPWRIVQRIDAGSAATASAALAEDIEGGADGAEISFAGSSHPAGGKLPPLAAATLSLPPLPSSFELRLDLAETVPPALLDIAAGRATTITVAHDPIAAFAQSAPRPSAESLRRMAAEMENRRIAGAAASADGRIWHAAGATDEQELAAVLATYVELMRLMDTAGRIGVALAADTDQFRTIAKFRAARLLLARISELAMFDGPAPSIHAETTWRAMTTLSAETNVVRSTIAAFGAAVGGADSIAVLPFDVARGPAGAQARRIARNTQLILAHEAGLSRVADPGAGSGAIETMTARLAESAWRRFQTIEKLGGMVAAIGEGSLLRDVAAARLARAAGIASGDSRMIGVNAYREDGLDPAVVRRAQSDREPRLVPLRVAASLE
ncbi:MAG TPA: methylmalonyl-CoA mutase family protein [Bauldia sp.]|nr:methylmalonyl-CoA mutase family protein [Bauldia sp.]